MLLKVTLYKTTRTGSQLRAEITFDGTHLKSSPPGYEIAILEGPGGTRLDPSDTAAVEAAMRRAPWRFDGDYLRAEFEDMEAAENVDESRPGSESNSSRSRYGNQTLRVFRNP